MSWSGVITDAGSSLITTWMSGAHTLTIDGASIGSGTVATADMHSSTALVSEQDDAAIVRSENVTGGIKIRLQFGPTENANAYSGKEIGIWARLDGGTKTLLSLHQDDGNGVEIPKKSTFPDFAFAISCVLYCDNTGNLEVEVDTDALVSVGDLEDAIAEVDFKAKAHVYTDLTHDGSTIASVKAAIGTCLISFYNDLKTHYSSVSNVVDETFTVRVKTSLCDCDCLVTVDTTVWFSFIAQTSNFGTVSGRCYIDASTTPASYEMQEFNSLARNEDIVTLEFNDPNLIDPRTYRESTLNISSYIDDADKYIVVGAEIQLVKKGSSDTYFYAGKWVSNYMDPHLGSDGNVKMVRSFPYDITIYNNGSSRYIHYLIWNWDTDERAINVRIMLKRIRNMISVI